MLYFLDYEIHGHCTIPIKANNLYEASLIAEQVQADLIKTDLKNMDIDYIDLHMEDADGNVY